MSKDLPQPQHSKEAERAVLAAVIKDGRVMADLVPILRPKDFYFDSHQKLYRVMVDLWDAQKPTDLVGIAEEIRRQQIDGIGTKDDGPYYFIADLLEGYDSPFTLSHAAIVRDKAMLRAAHYLGCDIVNMAADPGATGDDLFAEIQRAVITATETGATDNTFEFGERYGQYLDRLDLRTEKHKRGEASGLQSGFTELDALTAGSQDGELTIAPARTSVGKTAWALCTASHAAIELDVPVLFFTYEMSGLDLMERLLCCHAELNNQRIKRGIINPQEATRLTVAGDRFRAKRRFFISEAAGQTMLRVSATARRLKLRYGIRLVLVDYLQLIEPENRKETRQEQVAGISRRLKLLAGELQIPIIALAQLNREVESRADPTPRLSDLRESGAIEQDADNVLLLHRPKDDQGRDLDEVGVNLAKNRNGPQGRFRLRFVKEFMRFENELPV